MKTSDTVVLRGITWGHSRGYVPLVATAQRYAETHPGVEIVWAKRTLQEFADYPIDRLTQEYDLLVLDHPWAGFVAPRGLLLPLDEYLPAEYLEDQRVHQVGLSCESYRFAGHQWALAIDTATPVASYRPDVLHQHGEAVPRTWDELIALAKKGLVVMSGIPLDCLGHFNMLCGALGEEPFQRDHEVVRREIGLAAMEILRELAGYQTPEIFTWNPIRVYEALTARDDLAYCFSAYGYSNYARPGYARRPLKFTTMVTFQNGAHFRSTLGGAGLAISARCRHKEAAVDYAAYVAGPDCQKTVYAENGGQPGHRAAWLDARVNDMCGGFFRDTLPDLDRAFLRPRYDGYLHYQDNAGQPLWEYVTKGGSPEKALEAMNRLYRESSKRGSVR